MRWCGAQLQLALLTLVRLISRSSSSGWGSGSGSSSGGGGRSSRLGGLLSLDGRRMRHSRRGSSSGSSRSGRGRGRSRSGGCSLRRKRIGERIRGCRRRCRLEISTLIHRVSMLLEVCHRFLIHGQTQLMLDVVDLTRTQSETQRNETKQEQTTIRDRTRRDACSAERAYSCSVSTDSLLELHQDLCAVLQLLRELLQRTLRSRGDHRSSGRRRRSSGGGGGRGRNDSRRGLSNDRARTTKQTKTKAQRATQVSSRSTHGTRCATRRAQIQTDEIFSFSMHALSDSTLSSKFVLAFLYDASASSGLPAKSAATAMF